MCIPRHTHQMQVKGWVASLPVCGFAADEMREREGVHLAVLLGDVDCRVVDVMVNSHEYLAFAGIYQGVVLGRGGEVKGRGRKGRGEEGKEGEGEGRGVKGREGPKRGEERK